MNHPSVVQSMPRSRSVLERVRYSVRALGCSGVWARMSGPHVILGRDEGGAFARVTPLGPAAFALAFRAVAVTDEAVGGADASRPSGDVEVWDPVLLVDALADVVEHALVGEGALPQSA